MKMQQGLPKVLVRHCGIQLAILFLYATGLFFCGKLSSPNYVEYIGGMMMAVTLHVLVCLSIGIICFVLKRNDLGLAFLLAALLVALVGTSFCFGGMAVLPELHHK